MSHGPPDLPIHLVPPLGGLLSTRGGHGKGLQPCFTIREDLTERGVRGFCGPSSPEVPCALGRIGPQEVGADGGVRTVPVISECAAASRGVWGSVGRVGRVGRVGVSEFDTIDTR